MEYDDELHPYSFISGLALGSLIGAGLALLLAPQSGRRTRRRIARAAEDIGDEARDRIEDVADEMRHHARDAVRAAERGGTRLKETVRRGPNGR